MPREFLIIDLSNPTICERLIINEDKFFIKVMENLLSMKVIDVK